MKYMGSKARIADEILPIIMESYTDGTYYVEPFCGGMNMMSRLGNNVNRIANDANYYLIAMWRDLIDGVSFPTCIPRESYIIARTSYNEQDGMLPDSLIGWVGWMASYNGRFFDGGYSGHDVKTENGKSRDYIGEQIRNTLTQVDNLKGVELHSGDYAALPIPKNSIIYCDIPYKNTKQYSTSKDFDYERFYTWCENMAQLGHSVYISEYEMPEDRFECIWEKGVLNAMHQVNTKQTVERLYIVKQ